MLISCTHCVTDHFQVRLSPNVEVFDKFPRPEGVREGSMPYAAWKWTLADDSSLGVALKFPGQICTYICLKSHCSYENNVPIFRFFG